ncbi:MAG: hypothetical protein ACRDLB_04640 [Actinomycetota bacterium]
MDDVRPQVSRGPNATKMLRMRARRRLCALLERVSTAVGLILLKLRRDTETSTPTVMGALTAVAVAVTLPGGVSAPQPHQAGHRQIVRHQSAPEARELERDQPNQRFRTGALPRKAAEGPTSGEHEPPKARPVTIPVGNGYVEGQAELEIDDIHAEVGDRGGAIPICVGGVPGVPGDVDCAE